MFGRVSRIPAEIGIKFTATDKAEPAVRQGRKTAGLGAKIAGLPEFEVTRLLLFSGI
jgi:hypothetical protein